MLFTFAPVMPWRVTTHLLENEFGNIRTCWHERTLGLKQLLEILDRFRVLQFKCNQHGWNFSAANSAAVDNCRQGLKDHRTLPKSEPLSEAEALKAGKFGAQVASSLLEAGGWSKKDCSPWIDKLMSAAKMEDFLDLVNTHIAAVSVAKAVDAAEAAQKAVMEGSGVTWPVMGGYFHTHI